MGGFVAHAYRVSKDLLAGILLCSVGLLLAPLTCWRSAWLPQHCCQCFKTLLAHGLLARCVGAAVEWRLGNFGIAVTQLEDVVAALESSPQGQHAQARLVLQSLYTLLARMYLHSGHLDGALLLILRAHKLLGIDRLPALPELNIKTVPLLRASLAAGKLCEGDGLATLVVKTAVLPRNDKAKHPRQGRQGGAKVIPFPTSR